MDQDSGARTSARGAADAGATVAAGGASGGIATGGVVGSGGAVAVGGAGTGGAAVDNCLLYRKGTSSCLVLRSTNCTGYFDLTIPAGTCVVMKHGPFVNQNAQCSVLTQIAEQCVSTCATKADDIYRLQPEAGTSISLYLYVGTDACGLGEHGGDGFCRPCPIDKDYVCESPGQPYAGSCWSGRGATETYPAAIP